jgi:hypothetical protein
LNFSEVIQEDEQDAITPSANTDKHQKQGSDTNSYTTHNEKLLIALSILYSLQDEADRNEETKQKS